MHILEIHDFWRYSLDSKQTNTDRIVEINCRDCTFDEILKRLIQETRLFGVPLNINAILDYIFEIESLDQFAFLFYGVAHMEVSERDDFLQFLNFFVLRSFENYSNRSCIVSLK